MIRLNWCLGRIQTTCNVMIKLLLNYEYGYLPYDALFNWPNCLSVYVEQFWTLLQIPNCTIISRNANPELKLWRNRGPVGLGERHKAVLLLDSDKGCRPAHRVMERWGSCKVNNSWPHKCFPWLILSHRYVILVNPINFTLSSEKELSKLQTEPQSSEIMHRGS